MKNLILPAAFESRLKEKLNSGYDDFINSFSHPAPVSVRVNPFKKTSVFSDLEKVEWSDHGYYLPERISFTLDPLFHAGCYYVQEASSMYLEKVFKAVAGSSPIKVLDLCAAPGGKSTHLLSMLPSGSLLVSNEMIPARNKILQHNLVKWGCSNVIVTNNKPEDFTFMTGYFDIILVDAPCSGEGLFRKDHDAVDEWSEQAVNRCTARQQTILDAVIPSLKTNGVLIYSTCTYEDSENDMQCRRLIDENIFEAINLNEDNINIVKTDFGLQFYPHRIKGEGFYISALRKIEDADQVNIKGKENFNISKSGFLTKYLKQPEEFIPFQKNDELYAIPFYMKNDFSFIKNNLFLRQAGIHLGTIIKDDIIPAHNISLSHEISDEIGKIELDRINAIRYLKCESIAAGNESKGWYLASFEGFALGWIKSIGNRTNNYFPKELRILMK